MSAVVYHEPYRWSAGLLALAVHAAFFAFLYFGFTWQTVPAASMSVELWQNLPDEIAVQPVPVKEVEQIEQPVETPPPPPKPDIVLPAKKKPEPKPVVKKTEPKPVKVKPEPKAVTKPVEHKPDTRVADQQAAQAARERAEQDAAIGRTVDEYVSKIVSKIRRNVVMPPNVADDARAEFEVTLLPGGTVLRAKLLKSSGNVAYDDAVERAIIKSQPLPLPPDVKLFNRFRELKLSFKPVE